MKVKYLGLVGILALVSIFACQPAHVIASVDKGFQPEARAFQVGDQIYVEVKVPLVSGVDTWQAKFAGDTPEGFTSKSTSRETIYTWIVPKDRITWFGTNGYTVKLTDAEYSRDLNIRVIEKSANVSQWVIHIVTLGRL